MYVCAPVLEKDVQGLVTKSVNNHLVFDWLARTITINPRSTLKCKGFLTNLMERLTGTISAIPRLGMYVGMPLMNAFSCGFFWGGSVLMSQNYLMSDAKHILPFYLVMMTRMLKQVHIITRKFYDCLLWVSNSFTVNFSVQVDILGLKKISTKPRG